MHVHICFKYEEADLELTQPPGQNVNKSPQSKFYEHEAFFYWSAEHAFAEPEMSEPAFLNHCKQTVKN